MVIILMLIFGGNFHTIVDLNNNCKSTISDSIWKVLDESIKYYFPHNTKNVDLLIISFIRMKPDPLGI